MDPKAGSMVEGGVGDRTVTPTHSYFWTYFALNSPSRILTIRHVIQAQALRNLSAVLEAGGSSLKNGT